MWKSSIDDRLTKWKQFRKKLDTMSLDEALLCTAELWHTAPYKTFYLDPTSTIDWPNPWELISENYYCDIAKCLGIIYTIYFTNHCNNLVPEIRLYQDVNASQLYSLAWFNDGKYILNWDSGKVVNIEQVEEELKLICCYNSNDLILEKY